MFEQWFISYFQVLDLPLRMIKKSEKNIFKSPYENEFFVLKFMHFIEILGFVPSLLKRFLKRKNEKEDNSGQS